MAKKKYTAQCTIYHNGEKFKAGSPIEMDEKDAAELVKRGTLKLGNKDAEMTSPLPEPQKGETGKDEQKPEQITADAAANPITQEA